MADGKAAKLIHPASVRIAQASARLDALYGYLKGSEFEKEADKLVRQAVKLDRDLKALSRRIHYERT